MSEIIDFSNPSEIKWTCGVCHVAKRLSKNAENMTAQCNCGNIMVVRNGQPHFVTANDFRKLSGSHKYICPQCEKPVICRERATCKHTTHWHQACQDIHIKYLRDNTHAVVEENA